MKSRLNWLLIIAALIVVLPGIIATAKAESLSVGMVIGTGPKTSAAAFSQRARYTCRAAKVKIALAGYSRIQMLRCSGAVYQFSTWTKSGTKSGLDALKFDPFTGKIIRL